MSNWYLGGHTIRKAGWVNPGAVFVDFVSQYTSGWIWQLYCNRQLCGATRGPGERRVVGEIVASPLPAPLTLIRVDAAHAFDDFGAELPAVPCNRYRLDWTSSGESSDTHHFDVCQGVESGGALDETNIVGRVPYAGDGSYSFVLPPFQADGTWSVGVVPRDDAYPAGNAGTAIETTVSVVTPPPDVAWSGDQRFSASIAGGVLTVGFTF